MKDLSLHILDIAQNSITAGARHLDLTLTEEAGQIAFTVTDDGCGMSRALLEQVSDPFTTTRTTRKMGLGIPLLRMAAEQTGGSVEITSTEGAGTTLRAVFNAAHIDCPPPATWEIPSPCLSRARPCWRSSTPAQRTAAAFAWTPPSCGSSWAPGLPAQPEVALWVRDYIREQEAALHSPEPRTASGDRP